MGSKLRDNNPAIADLNDQNRPMKLAEQFTELYENEWTDAFTALQEPTEEGSDEKITEAESIRILLNMLKVCADIDTFYHSDSKIFCVNIILAQSDSQTDLSSGLL